MTAEPAAPATQPAPSTQPARATQPAPATPGDSGHYADRILRVLAEDPARPAMWWRDTMIPAAELREAILRVAAALRGLGLRPDGTVAILTEVNSPWMLAVRYAAHLLGATAVYITGANHGTTTHGLSTQTRVRMIGECGASVLAFDGGNREEAEAIRRQAPEFGLCQLGQPVSGAVRANGQLVTELLADWVPRAPRRCTVLYTSGSSGQAKGVCKRFSSWNSIAMTESAASPPQAFLAVSAVSHTVGLLVDVAMASGGSVLLRTEFDPGSLLRDIARYRITDTLMGVAQFYELVAHPDVPSTDLSSLRRLLYIGAAASPERMKHAAKVFPGVLNHTFGTTETGSVALLRPADHEVEELVWTAGRPRPEVTVAICDPDTGQELPPGQVGEVLVNSPHNMEGYIGDPGLTDKVLRDGWVHTGDLGSLGENGYLRLVGRMNDVAKIKDTRIHPNEVEKLLAGHDGVVNAYVYGYRRPDLIEELHAAVVLKPDRQPSFAALREHISQAMTPTHAPAKFVRWREFPTNSNGKVNRLLVRERNATAGPEDETLVLGR